MKKKQFNIRIRLIFFLIAILPFLHMVPLYATQKAPDHAQLFSQDPIRIAYCSDCVPFHFQDKEGKPAGILIDLWRLWAQKTGQTVAFDPFSWDESLKKVGGGAYDAHAGLFYNETRDQYLDYGSSLSRTSTHIFLHKGLPAITNMAEITAYRIGVLSGDYVEGFLKDKFPSATIVPYASYEAIVQALNQGEIKAFAADTPSGIYHLKKAGRLHEFNISPSQLLYANDWFVAVTAGSNDLLHYLNEGFKRVSRQERLDVIRRWSSQDHGKALVIAIDRDYPPLTKMTSFGEPAGLLVDFWRAWAKKSGHDVRFRMSDGAGTLKALKAGEADIHSGLFLNKERKEYLSFSKPIYKINSSFYFRRNHQLPNDPARFGASRVGVMESSYQLTALKQQFPEMSLVSYSSWQGVLQALKSGAVDAAIGEDPTMEVLLDELGLRGAITVAPAPYFSNNVYGAVVKEQQTLLENVDQGLGSLSLEQKAQLERIWIKNPRHWVFKASPEQVKRSLKLTDEEQQWLKDNPVIRVGNEMDWPPFDFVEKKKASGFSIDLMRLLARKSGLRLQFINGLKWSELLARFKTGQIDVLPAIMDIPERRVFTDFTEHYITNPTVIVVDKRHKNIRNIEDMRGKRLAIVKGYYYEQSVRDHFPDITVVPVPGFLEGLEAVVYGNVDGFVGSQMVINHTLEKHALAGLQITGRSGIDDMDRFKVRIGVRKSYPKPLHSILEKALQSVTSEERQELRKRWLGLSAPEFFPALTIQERQWLKQHPVIRVGSELDYPPYALVNQAGEADGYSVDLFKAVAKVMGLEVQFQVGPWDTVRTALEQGHIEALPLVGYSPERDKLFDFTPPHTISYAAVFKNKNTKMPSRIEDLKGQRIVVMQGDATHDYLVENKLDHQLVLVKTIPEALKKLDAGDAELALVPRLVGVLTLKELNLSKVELTSMQFDLYGRGFGFAVQEGNSALLAQLNHGLKIIKEIGEYQRIQDKWFGVAQVSTPPQEDEYDKDLQLTTAEKAWLKAHPEIRMGDDFAWPPFSYQNDDGQFSGIASGFVDVLSNKLNLQFNPVWDLKWPQVIQGIKARKLDVVPIIVPTEERRKEFLFTKPYISFPVIIATRKDGQFIDQLSDLEKQKVGVVNGYITHEHLKRDHPTLNLVPQDTTLAGLQALEQGKIDAFIGNLGVITYTLDKRQMDQIRVAAPTPYSYDLAMGVRKDWPELVSILDKGLNTLDARDRAAIKNSWMAINIQFGTDLRTILIWVLPIGIVLLLIIGMTLFWNRRLGQEIEQRQRAEGEMKKLSLAVENSPSMVMITDPHGIIEYVNPRFVEVTGFECSELEGKTASILKSEPTVPDHFQTMWQTINKGQIWRGEVENCKKNGERYWASISISPVLREGQIDHFISLQEDITEQKQVAEAIKEREERLDLALRGGNLGFWDVDLETGHTVVNHRYSEIFGYATKDIKQIRQLWMDSLHPEDREQVLKVGEAYRQGRMDDYEVEYRILTKEGETRWVVSKGAGVVWHQDGRVRRMVGTVQDITNFKQAELTIKQSEARFRNLVEGFGSGYFFYSHDRDGVFTYVSPSVEKMLGYTPDEFMVNFTEILTDAPMNEGAELKAQHVMQGEKVPAYQVEVKNKDGRVFQLQVSEVPHYDENGEVVGLEGIAHDISELKKAEKEIRDSQHLMTMLVDSIPSIVFMKDRDEKHVLINDYFKTALGVTSDDVIGKTVYDFPIPKEAADLVHQQDRKVLDDDVRMEYEESLPNPEGEMRHYFTRKIPFRDVQGQPIGLVGIATDITERKIAEQGIQEKLTELEKFSAVAIGRELRMINLKQEINELRTQLGHETRYEIPE
ncbi:transporter substrate-binding domain-containing protein [Magnetococcus sp. PR-3]|uniref:transporter substrate-binding domain-containing protein n=1 Tax=Magnetococcus sp. PR-3 TaxID=3120355 RepID=UPI002FCE199F